MKTTLPQFVSAVRQLGSKDIAENIRRFSVSRSFPRIAVGALADQMVNVGIPELDKPLVSQSILKILYTNPELHSRQLAALARVTSSANLPDAPEILGLLLTMFPGTQPMAPEPLHVAYMAYALTRVSIPCEPFFAEVHSGIISGALLHSITPYALALLSRALAAARLLDNLAAECNWRASLQGTATRYRAARYWGHYNCLRYRISTRCYCL